MSVIDWIGIVLLIPFGLVVLGLIVALVAGCIGSGKRRRRVLIERSAAREEALKATESPRPSVAAANSDAADERVG